MSMNFWYAGAGLKLPVNLSLVLKASINSTSHFENQPQFLAIKRLPSYSLTDVAAERDERWYKILPSRLFI
jgi:hypothetical protein